MPNYNNWIRCFHPNPDANFRLFCFPYAGGGATIFRKWANNLPANIEVCAIQLPGREDRLQEKPFTDIFSLVKALLPFLAPYLNLPFAFFGHSLGALISFELARQLPIKQQQNLAHLFISGRRAPQVPDSNPLMHTLPEAEFLAQLRQMNGTPKQVLENRELMQLFLPVLRADFSICGTYIYIRKPPLDASISVFGGTEDTMETGDLLAEWIVQTNSSFSIKMFNGDHFFLSSQQELLLKTLSLNIDKLARRC